MIKKTPKCKDCMNCYRRKVECECKMSAFGESYDVDYKDVYNYYCYLLEREVVGDIPIICSHFRPREDGDGFPVRNLVGRKSDAVMIDESVNKNNFFLMFMIKKVIFNDPATIVLWRDGHKTVVKCQDGDEFDKEKGLAMAIVKYCCGNNGFYNDIFRKWCKDESDDTQEYSFTVSSSNTGLELFSKYARQKLAGEITFEIGSKKEKRK